MIKHHDADDLVVVKKHYDFLKSLPAKRTLSHNNAALVSGNHMVKHFEAKYGKKGYLKPHNSAVREGHKLYSK